MKNGTLTIAQPLLRLVDPHECTDNRQARSVHHAIFDALVVRGPDFKMVPALAESWELSEDARTWIFRLRDGVRFHNGEPFDSEAAAFSLMRMGGPDAGSALGQPAVYAQYLGGARIEPIDARRLRLTTESPNADLLDILVDAYMVPPRSAEELGPKFATNPIGTGAFQFVGSDPGDRIVAEANRSHFRGPPSAKRGIWRLVRDPEDRIAGLRTGEVDIASDLRPGDAQLLTAAHGVFRRFRGTMTVAYFFNCARGPMRDRRVRQALNLAIDRNEIIKEVLDGAGYPLSSLAGPGHLGFDPTLELYRPDLREASRLLAESGYANGLVITVSSPSSLPDEALVLATTVARQLGKVGIEATIEVTSDRTEYAHKVRRKEIGDLCLFDSSPLSTHRVLREKLSGTFRGAWWQGYESPQLDHLIEMGSRTVDESEREAIYRQCFRLIHDDAPWLFLYNPEDIYGVSEALRDWSPTVDGFIDPRHLP